MRNALQRGLASVDLVAAARPTDETEGTAVFAYVCRGDQLERVSRAMLWTRATRYSKLYSASNLPRGSTVAIIMDHSWDMLAAFLGAMRAGLIPAFMPVLSAKQNPDSYWKSHEGIFRRLAPGALLTELKYIQAIRANLPGLELALLASDDYKNHDSAPGTDYIPDPQDTAFLQHSSGTTGLKKGVALTHTQVLAQLRSYSDRLELDPSDCIVSWLPYYHDMGLVACFLLPLVTRIPVVILDPFEWVAQPGRLFAAIERHRGTLCWQPNFAFQHLCRTVPFAKVGQLASMRSWINCSEPCRVETLHRFAAQYADAGVHPNQLQVCYAMAETVFAVTQTP